MTEGRYYPMGQYYWAYCIVGGGFCSPLQWTLPTSPCFSYGRGNDHSASLSAQWFWTRTRPRI